MKKSDTLETISGQMNDFGLATEKSPAAWMQKAGFLINDLFIKTIEKIDTAKLTDEFNELDRITQTMYQNVLSFRDREPSIKELNDFVSQANSLKERNDNYGEEIKKISTALINRYTLASLINDDAFEKVIKKDSALRSIYTDEFNLLKENAADIKMLALKSMKAITANEKQRNDLTIKIVAVIEVLKAQTLKWGAKVVSQDEPPIWNLFGREYKDFRLVFEYSFNFVYNSFTLYINNAINALFFIKLFFIIIPIILLSLYRNIKLRRRLKEYENMHLHYINEFPWIIPSFVILLLLGFLLYYPPLIISQLILLVIMFLTSYIAFKKFITRKYILPFLSVFIYYVLVKINDFILEPTVIERIFYFLSIVPVILLVKMLFDYSKEPFGHKLFVKSAVIFLIFHLSAGFVLNVVGRVALGKVIISGGVRAAFMAVFINIAVYAVMDYIYILVRFYDMQKNSIEINLDKVKDKIFRLLVFFAVIIWFGIYLVELNSFAFVYNYLGAFFAEKRMIGSTYFTFGGAAVFMLILFLSFYISGLLKQIIEVNDISGSKIKRSSSGGFFLLLRLFIISIGFLLALAASGIPLDKITLMISALGVGIGFGLQNIISNLVSGVIIAIEKPFRVGDLVNFGGIDGKVKVIGIRSSIVTTEDGSELIIPNGDLISKNLINWTSNNKFRKDRLNVQIDSAIPENDFRSLINTAAQSSDISAFITGLQSNIVSYSKGLQKWELSFWITDIAKHSAIKSGLIQSIYKKLDEENIKVVSFE